jgi:hypothetical protein
MIINITLINDNFTLSQVKEISKIQAPSLLMLLYLKKKLTSQ